MVVSICKSRTPNLSPPTPSTINSHHLHSLLLKPYVTVSLTQDPSVPLVSVSAYEPKMCGLRSQFATEPSLIGTNRFWYLRSLSLTIFESCYVYLWYYGEQDSEAILVQLRRFLWSIINISHKWGIRGWQTCIRQAFPSSLVSSVCDVFFIVPRGIFFPLYKVSVSFWKKRTGVDSESQVADFLEACHVGVYLGEFINNLNLTLKLGNSDFVSPPRVDLSDKQTHSNQTHSDWCISQVPKQKEHCNYDVVWNVHVNLIRKKCFLMSRITGT